MRDDSFFTVYRGGEVRRFHTMRVLHSQSVGEHSWGVAVILLWLYGRSLPPARLLHAAMLHDVPEACTGDVPAMAKWENRDLDEALATVEATFRKDHGISAFPLSTHEVAVLKYADLADLVCYALTEMEMGHSRMKAVADRGLEKLKAMQNTVPDRVRARAEKLYDRLDTACGRLHNGKERT